MPKTLSTTRIMSDLELNCSKTTVWRTLKNSGEVEFIKMLAKPPLTDAHKIARINFAENHINNH